MLKNIISVKQKKIARESEPFNLSKLKFGIAILEFVEQLRVEQKNTEILLAQLQSGDSYEKKNIEMRMRR